MPAQAGDHSMAIINTDGYVYDFWNVQSINLNGDGQIHCGFCRRSQLSGTGTTDGNGWQSGIGGITAGGYSLAWGLLRTDEFVTAIQNYPANPISHGLFCSIDNWDGRVIPAVGPGGTSGQVTGINAPPMGGLLRWDPTYMTSGFLTGSGFPVWKKVILIAMRDFGMYIGDQGSSCLTIHMESETPYWAYGIKPTNLDYSETVAGNTGSWDLNTGINLHKLQLMNAPASYTG
jgi:hypothetical protein